MVPKTQSSIKEYKISEAVIEKKPFYVEVKDEISLFRVAYEERIPVMLKGPTGCGKSRLVEFMAYEINQELRKNHKDANYPLITVPCHEDLTADDLKGRFLLNGDYEKGPALSAVSNAQGAMLYLDEIVEARNDTLVVIHPLGDYRRMLTVEKLGKVFEAPKEFMLVVSYNPGYQKKTKDLKQSTRQRFMAIEMNYAQPELEKKIIEHEAGIGVDLANSLVQVGGYVRNLKGKGLDEGASTRLLIHAGKLIKNGISPKRACVIPVVNPITDDVDAYREIHKGLEDVVENVFPK